MDPLSIATGCVGLIGSITKISVSISAFVKEVRGARGDMDGVSRELQSLKSILELLEIDSQPQDPDDSSKPPSFPESLQKQVTGIMSNCTGVLEQMQVVLEKHQGNRIDRSAMWALRGKADVANLRISLEAHKSALEIALDMLALSIVKDIKEDTTDIKGDTEVIIGNTNDIKEDTALLLQEISRLRTQVAEGAASQAQGSGRALNFTLERYLDDLSSYAETVVGDDIDAEEKQSRTSLDAVTEEGEADGPGNNTEEDSKTRLEKEHLRRRIAELELAIKEKDSETTVAPAVVTQKVALGPNDLANQSQDSQHKILGFSDMYEAALRKNALSPLNNSTTQSDESSRVQSRDDIQPQASLEEAKDTVETVCAETLYGIFPDLDRAVIAKVVREKEGRIADAVDACLLLVDKQPGSNKISSASDSVSTSALKPLAPPKQAGYRSAVGHDSFMGWVDAAAPKSKGAKFVSGYDQHGQDTQLYPEPAFHQNWPVKETLPLEKTNSPSSDLPRATLGNATRMGNEQWITHVVREEVPIDDMDDDDPYTMPPYRLPKYDPHEPLPSAYLSRAASSQPAPKTLDDVVDHNGLLLIDLEDPPEPVSTYQILRPYSIAVPSIYFGENFKQFAPIEEFATVRCSFTTRYPTVPVHGQPQERFSPRLKSYYPPRPVALMIVVDMNTRGSLVLTLQTLFGEIGSMCEESVIAWENIIVCLMGHIWLDHVKACLPMLEEMGIYPSWDAKCTAHPTILKPRVYESTITSAVMSTAADPKSNKATKNKDKEDPYQIGSFKPLQTQLFLAKKSFAGSTGFAPLDRWSREWAEELNAKCSILIKRGTAIKDGALREIYEGSVSRRRQYPTTKVDDLVEYKNGSISGWRKRLGM